MVWRSLLVYITIRIREIGLDSLRPCIDNIVRYPYRARPPRPRARTLQTLIEHRAGISDNRTILGWEIRLEEGGYLDQRQQQEIVRADEAEQQEQQQEAEDGEQDALSTTNPEPVSSPLQPSP